MTTKPIIPIIVAFRRGTSVYLVGAIIIFVGLAINLVNTWYHGWNWSLTSEATIDGFAGAVIGFAIGMMYTWSKVKSQLRKDLT